MSITIINIRSIIFLFLIGPLIGLNNYNIKYIKLSIIIITINTMLVILSLLMQKTLLITIINATLIN